MSNTSLCSVEEALGWAETTTQKDDRIQEGRCRETTTQVRGSRPRASYQDKKDYPPGIEDTCHAGNTHHSANFKDAQGCVPNRPCDCEGTLLT